MLCYCCLSFYHNLQSIPASQFIHSKPATHTTALYCWNSCSQHTVSHSVPGRSLVAHAARS
jgi:hypothetical protein